MVKPPSKARPWYDEHGPFCRGTGLTNLTGLISRSRLAQSTRSIELSVARGQPLRTLSFRNSAVFHSRELIMICCHHLGSWDVTEVLEVYARRPETEPYFGHSCTSISETQNTHPIALLSFILLPETPHSKRCSKGEVAPPYST